MSGAAILRALVLRMPLVRTGAMLPVVVSERTFPGNNVMIRGPVQNVVLNDAAIFRGGATAMSMIAILPQLILVLLTTIIPRIRCLILIVVGPPRGVYPGGISPGADLLETT